MIFTHKLSIGCVIMLDQEQCNIVDTAEYNREYVVEHTEHRGGRYVMARLLTDDGKYHSNNKTINFYQSPGYKNTLDMVLIVRFMKRIFV